MAKANGKSTGDSEAKKPKKKSNALRGLLFLIIIGVVISAVVGRDKDASEDAKVEEEATGAEEDQAAAPVISELSLEDDLTQCQEASAETFAQSCLGKQVIWVLSFVGGMEEAVTVMNIPGDYEQSVKATFSETPDWGERGALAWTGRRVSVAATLAEPNGGIVLEEARLVEDETWRDRAVEIVKEDERYLDAIWASGDISFWVAMANTGRDWDFEAQGICQLLWRAGRPDGFSVVVTILDAARIEQQEELAKARCS